MSDQPLKYALYRAAERLLDESLAAVRIQDIRLHLTPEAFKKLQALPEFREHPVDLPEKAYGFPIFVTPPHAPTSVLTIQEEQIVRRIVPQAYVWADAAGCSWTAPLEFLL